MTCKVSDIAVHDTLGLCEVVGEQTFGLVARKLVSDDTMTWVVNPKRLRLATDTDVVNALVAESRTYEIPSGGKFIVTKSGDLLLQSWMSEDIFVLNIDEVRLLKKILHRELV